MKKYLLLMVAIFLVFTVGCSKKDSKDDAASSQSEVEEKAVEAPKEKTYDDLEKEKEDYNKSLATSTTPFGPNALVPFDWNATMEDVKNKEKYIQETNFNGVIELDSLAEKEERKDGIWQVSRGYAFKENGFYIYTLTHFRVNESLDGIDVYKEYQSLKAELTKIYGEPVYLRHGEQRWEDDVIKQVPEDPKAFNDAIINGQLELGCNFVAKDTKITLDVSGSNTDDRRYASVDVGFYKGGEE